MAAQYHSLFTAQGLELLREAIQNGTKLGITHMSYGDGNGTLPVPDASFTKMVKEVYRTQLNRLAPSKENPNWLEADGVIPSAVGGFNIREVGLWAGNIMVAYANYPPTYKPSADQGTAQIKTIRIVLQIDNTANFELKIDASVVMATIQSVEEAKAEAKDFSDKTKVQRVNTIEELLSLEVWEGRTARVTDDYRGGTFYYDAGRTGENNKGTVFNGWIRKYFGSVYLDWFCETDPKTTDCSLYMERALNVTKGVKCSGRDFLFTGRVGIPDSEQSNYAWKQIKIKGDGDTTFHIDCLAHGRPTFTSAAAKPDPKIEENLFVGKVEFKEINFIGVNTPKGFELNEANKNIVDSVFDGDRLYNSSAMFCNFVHLRSPLRCLQSRGEDVEGGNAYSQSFTLSMNHFYHCTYWAEADQFLNFTCIMNQGERNYNGIKAYSKSDSPALGVCAIDYNLFEGGGMFIDVKGDIRGGSIWNNYLEYNIIGRVLEEKCQILIDGQVQGGVIGANNFGGQINFDGHDSEYMDIKVQGKPYNTARTDVTKSKPVLIGNCSTSRQMISRSRALEFGNAYPYTTSEDWAKTEDGAGYFNNMSLHLPTENDVTFSRGTFNQFLNKTETAPNGTLVSTLDANSQLIVAIIDLSHLENGMTKNTMSTLTGEVDCNIELIRDGLTIGNISAKMHVSIISTGYGSAAQEQYNQVRVHSNLISIIQPYDIPIVLTHPKNLLKRQFVEPDVNVITEPLGNGRYALRLTNYLGAGVGTFGAPNEIYNTFTWQASVGCRNVIEHRGAGVTFINDWWE